MRSSESEHDKFSAEALYLRQQDIVGKPPRIAGINVDAMSVEQRDLISRLRAAISANDSEVSEYFLILAKYPALLQSQLALGTVLFKGKLAPRERELSILRVGWLCRAPYEWGEHVKIAKRDGVTAYEIERVALGSEAEGWSEHEAAILRAVEQLVADQMIDDETWEILSRTWDEQQLIELPALVGQYIAVALIQNSIRLRLETGSAGLTSR